MRLIKFLTVTIIMLPFTQRSVHALDNPTYQNGVLTIPTVDTPEQVGLYKDIKMTRTEDATWRLDFYNGISNTDKESILQINKVDLIITDILPKQVFLHLEGRAGCDSVLLGKVSYRINNGVFELSLGVDYAYYKYLGCRFGSWTYQKTIALPVLGLKAGTYAYNLNGAHKGSFTLDVDNNLPAYPADVTWHPSFNKKPITEGEAR
jgi:hypothetical protein